MARSRSPTALSPRLKRSWAATPSSTPRARKKQLNTRGVSSNTSAMKPRRVPGRESGRPTNFSRCRREKDSSPLQEHVMRALRYAINVTLNGCCDYRAIPTDEELHRHFAGLNGAAVQAITIAHQKG